MNKTRYFEWVAGESMGEIVILESLEEFDGQVYYHFTNGDTCSEEFISAMTNNVSDLKGKFMVEIESVSNAWSFSTVEAKKYVDQSMNGEEVVIPTLHDMLKSGNGSSANVESDIGRKKLVPPKSIPRNIPKLPRLEDYVKKTVDVPVATAVLTPPPSPVIESVLTPVIQIVDVVNEDKVMADRVVEQPKPKHSFDPVRILVETCKKHDTEIDLTLSIKLPARSMYMIADSEFENGGDKFIDFVVDDIDVSMIVEAVRQQLKHTYAGTTNQG